MKLNDLFSGSGWRIAFWVVSAIFCFFSLLLIYAVVFIDYSKDAETAYLSGFFYIMLLIMLLIPLFPALIVLGILAFVVFRKRTKEEVEMLHEEHKYIEIEKPSTGLSQNVAGMLCYILGWLSGLVFILIERKNRFARFHAMQSIIVFGILTIAIFVLNRIPFGPFLASSLSLLTFILWIVLMVKAYKGAIYKLPWAGNLAEKWAGSLNREEMKKQAQQVEMTSEKSVAVQEEIETLKHTPNKCPYCSSASISEHIVEGPLSESDMKASGYYYKWDCQCSDCGTRWFGID